MNISSQGVLACQHNRVIAQSDNRYSCVFVRDEGKDREIVRTILRAPRKCNTKLGRATQGSVYEANAADAFVRTLSPCMCACPMFCDYIFWVLAKLFSLFLCLFLHRVQIRTSIYYHSARSHDCADTPARLAKKCSFCLIKSKVGRKGRKREKRASDHANWQASKLCRFVSLLFCAITQDATQTDNLIMR